MQYGHLIYDEPPRKTLSAERVPLTCVETLQEPECSPPLEGGVRGGGAPQRETRVIASPPPSLPFQRRGATKRSVAGFSLVEVIVAMVILGIGILAFMRFFPLGLRNVQIAQERTVASELANDRIGRIQMAGPRQLEFTGVFGGDTFNLTNILQATSIYGFYNLPVYEGFTTHIQPMTGSKETGLKRVTFAVELPGGRRETYVTYITDL